MLMQCPRRAPDGAPCCRQPAGHGGPHLTRAEFDMVFNGAREKLEAAAQARAAEDEHVCVGCRRSSKGDLDYGPGGGGLWCADCGNAVCLVEDAPAHPLRRIPFADEIRPPPHERTCGHQLACGGTCIGPTTEQHVHMCGGDNPGEPGSCPA